MERRLKPRVEWNGPIKYRASQTENYKTGVLVNVSTTGAMLWLKGDYEKGTRLEVVMQSQFDPEPVNMHMHVVRIEKIQREGYTGYGCALETTDS